MTSTLDRKQQNDSLVAQRFSMTGRRALVTGGSLGIGREVALAFAEAGADVAVQYLEEVDAGFGYPSAAAAVADDVAQRGRQCALIEADFAVPGEAARCVAQTRSALGGLDVLVVCASIQYRTPFADVTEEQMDRQYQVNFKATVELLQAALSQMKDAGYGRILMIGSVNQVAPEPLLAVYAALKSAQFNLAFNLAREYAPHGVTINNLSPGLIATGRNRWRREDPDEWRRIEAACSPMGRSGRPSEMAGAALLLCSEAGSYITGADLQATGGRHLPGPASPR